MWKKRDLCAWWCREYCYCSLAIRNVTWQLIWTHPLASTFLLTLSIIFARSIIVDLAKFSLNSAQSCAFTLPRAHANRYLGWLHFQNNSKGVVGKNSGVVIVSYSESFLGKDIIFTDWAHTHKAFTTSLFLSLCLSSFISQCYT